MPGKKEKGISKLPMSKNVYGDKEFIVKLQPPVGESGMPSCPWMCYDGPTRSFHAYIPVSTPSLKEIFDLMQRDGVRAVNPMSGQSGFKGYFKARWEGCYTCVL